MSYVESVSPTANVTVALPKHFVSVGIYDELTEEYVIGTIIVDGIRYPDINYKLFEPTEGIHTFDIETPAGYEFVSLDVHDWNGPLIQSSRTKPVSLNVVKNINVWAVLRQALVETALTISAPSSVEPGANIAFTGRLTRPDTGAGLAGQTYVLESPPGTTAKTGTTDASGNYSITATAPTVEGTYQYRTSFAGNSVYGSGFSRTLGLGVGIVTWWEAVKAWWNGLNKLEKAIILGASIGGAAAGGLSLTKT